MSTLSLLNQTKLRDRGRPREFDIDSILDKVIICFRTHGYNGVSIADLSDAIGLSAGSIYKAFHSKHELFCRALDRYMQIRGEKISDIVKSSETGKEKLHRILKFYADSSYSLEGLQGCLVIVGAVELASVDPSISEKVAIAMSRNEDRLEQLILEGQRDQSIPTRINASATARTLLAMVQGMRVLGKTGQSKESSLLMVETAMRLLE